VRDFGFGASPEDVAQIDEILLNAVRYSFAADQERAARLATHRAELAHLKGTHLPALA
jgi:hypothetical protein